MAGDFGFNRKSYKPCPSCHGVGKPDHTICPRCHGYGSVGLSVIMRSKAATMRGDGALPKAKGGV